MVEQNKATARRMCEDVFTKGDMTAFEEVCSPSLVAHHPEPPHETRGRDAFGQRFASWKEAFPNLTVTVDDLVSEGDRVAVRYTASGTNEGQLMGAPATGKEMNVQAVAIWRFENGQIAEMWDAWDAMGLMQQLGLMPQAEAVT